MLERITSAKNPTVKGLRALNQRKGRVSQGRFLVEGEVLIREALDCGLTMVISGKTRYTKCEFIF